MSSLERTVAELFSGEGSRIGNVKFFKGSDPQVNAQQLVDQFTLADQQVAEGNATRVDDIDGDLDA